MACRMLVRLDALLGIYSDLVRYYVAVSMGAHRSTGKLLSVLASVFTQLAQKVQRLRRGLLFDVELNGKGCFFARGSADLRRSWPVTRERGP